MTILSETTVISDRFQILNLIGKGSFAQVYSVIDLKTGNKCALKIVNLLHLFYQTNSIDSFEKEAWILKHLSQNNNYGGR